MFGSRRVARRTARRTARRRDRRDWTTMIGIPPAGTTVGGMAVSACPSSGLRSGVRASVELRTWQLTNSALRSTGSTGRGRSTATFHRSWGGGRARDNGGPGGQRCELHWWKVSARLERADLTAPIVFVVVGAILAALGLVDSSAAPESLKPLVSQLSSRCSSATPRGSGFPIFGVTSADTCGCSGSASRSPSCSGGCWRSGLCRGSTCGSPCSSPRHWRRPMRRWVCRS